MDILGYKHFTVVGDTLNQNKYAYTIKNKLLENNYNVSTVNKHESLNDVKNIEIIVLCINPIDGLRLIKELKSDYILIVIQPGAESSELLNYLIKNNMLYIEGCLLKVLENN